VQFKNGIKFDISILLEGHQVYTSAIGDKTTTNNMIR